MKTALLLVLLFIFVADSFSQPRDDSLNVTRIHRFLIEDNPYGIAMDGNTVYLSDQQNTFRILDIARRDSFTVVGQCSISNGSNNGLALHQNYVLISSSTLGIDVVDVSIPSQPYQRRTFTGVSVVQDLEIFGNYAYCAAWNNFYVLDLTNIDSIQLVGTYTTPGDAVAVRAVENRVYLADNYGGFRIYDSTNPLALIELGNNSAQYSALSIDVQGNLVYIASGFNGLNIYNVNNPAQPQLVRHYTQNGSMMYVRVNGNYAYCAAYGNGLHVLNILNPTNVHRVGFYDPFNAIWKTLPLTNECLTLGNQELTLYDVAQALPVIERVDDGATLSQYSLSQNYPNPFNRETRITYALPRVSTISLALYDVQGRLVQSLFRGLSQDAGTYSVTLNGAGLSSGVYYVKLNAGEFTQTIKIIYMK